MPLSETVFSLGGSFEFVVNDRGVATELIWHTVERDQKAVRTSENARAKPR